MRRLQPIASSAQTKAIAVAVSLLVHALVVIMVTNISIPKVELPTRTKFIAVSLSPGETIDTQLPVPEVEVQNTPEVTNPIAPTLPPVEPNTTTKPIAAKQLASATTQPRVNPQPSPEVPKAKQSTPLTPTLAQPPSTNTPASPAAPATPVEPTKASPNNNLAAEFAKEANSLKEAAEADAQQKRSAEQTAKALKEEVKQQAVERRKLGDKTAKLIGDKVYENWVVPITADNYKAIKVRITLSATGTVLSITPLERSGSNAIDESAKAAIHDAAPFAMPDDIEVYNKYLRIITITMDPRKAGR